MFYLCVFGSHRWIVSVCCNFLREFPSVSCILMSEVVKRDVLVKLRSRVF